MQKINTNILGSNYEVQVGKRKETGISKELMGQCCPYLHTIQVEHSMRDCETEKERDMRTVDIVAHEVFHAYAHESGLNLPEDIEENIAVWYEKMWRRINNSIIEILDELNLLDNK